MAINWPSPPTEQLYKFREAEDREKRGKKARM
jgi:hypothetical protein